MSGDTPYEHLSDEHGDDHRWAFGTGFTDPLEGIDTSVPAGLDPTALATYCLMLGDDALIYSHRLQQWMTRMPELEEETALANIALDLLGQARMLLSRAAGIEDTSEDALAFFRAEHEYRLGEVVGDAQAPVDAAAEAEQQHAGEDRQPIRTFHRGERQHVAHDDDVFVHRRDRR